MFLTHVKATKKGTGEAGTRLSVVEVGWLRFEAAVLRLLWWASLLLGPERASDAGARVMSWLSGPDSNTMSRIRRNLQIALPNKDEQTIERLTREAVAGLGRTVVEYPHLQRIANSAAEGFVDFVADVPNAVLSPKSPPAIYIAIHQANWEVISSIAAPLGNSLTVVVSPLSNPFIGRLVSQARPKVWVQQTERDSATRNLVRCLQSGRSVALLADQRFDRGQMVPFFGQDAMTAIGPAKLAIRFGCDLVPTRIERIGSFRFRITTFEAIRPAGNLHDGDKAIDMMRRVNLLFEAWIREKPGEWMCMKRRWPIPVYERAG